MTSLDRRHALGFAAVAAASPVLVACGGSGSQRSPQSDPATNATSPDGAGDAPAELVAAADVPVGGGVILADRQLVVTQPTEGQFKAFSSICTHQSCPVTKVAEGSIDCSCHGSRFSIEDGSVLDGPAPEPLGEQAVKVSGDSITLG